MSKPEKPNKITTQEIISSLSNQIASLSTQITALRAAIFEITQKLNRIEELTLQTKIEVTN